MKSKWKLLSVSLATALLLAACGTEAGNENPAGEKEEPAGVVEETNNGAPAEETVTDESEPAESGQETAEEPSDEQANGLTDAVRTESDEQDFAISVLPGYSLTSEEPGKDSLMVDDDSAIFMRIETMSASEVTVDEFLENTRELVSAATDVQTPEEVTDEVKLPQGDGIKDAVAYSAQTDSVTVTSTVFERDGQLIRLTVFDSPDEKHFENFLRMGETIQKK
ncbi:hypothetical protein AB1K83_02235 [Sporosarcina sp. 179-K 3D1 HS]|uniref:hypothetical protein n=1 Tax=Sporosarcina sp. 179-K 3D1 HS TaxID=3232169 RepID=UPI0039A1BD1E